MRRPLVSLLPLLASLLVSGSALRADEGMWTFDNLPLQKMKAKYGFAPDQAWLDHVRLSSLRFPGGSGSFVSKDGLVLTNHHVGHDWIQRVGDKDHDYVKQGFVAADRERELKVPGLALFTLVSLENVTDKVEAAVKAGMSEKDADKARSEAMDKLLVDEHAKTGLECHPVSLYQGGQRWIYRYKKHTDVRLVMAPEKQVAAFGGDWDNFSYQRHDLDFSLFRVYEDGKPYQTPHHLKWTETGIKYGDLTFTSGHPGSTARLETLAQMRYARDFAWAITLRTLDRRRQTLHAYAAQGPEQARQVSAQLLSAENSFKAITGYWEGLKDKGAMAKVEAAEKELRAKVAKDPKLQATGQSWTKIEAALAQRQKMAKDLAFVNTRGSQLLGYALQLVRLAGELPKASAQRLEEFRSEESVKAMKARLAAPAPIYKELEQVLLAAGLEEAKAELGAAHPFVQALLGGKAPAEAAKALIEGSKLGDPEVRKQLLEGGAKAVAESKDPFVLLAKKLDPLGRRLRKQQEAIQAILAEHGARIAKARFQVYGTSDYPDATFTLRLSYGAVETYAANGTLMQPFTTFGGLYDRADAWGPEAEKGSWSLPSRWREKRSALNLSTPYNFISSNDIIGGNSGSPVVDRKGELIGLAFDGNIEGLPGRYYYDGRVNRTISVDARAIQEALDKVYEAAHLVKELKGQ